VACGTLCQFVTNILALALYFRQPSCSYRLVWPVKQWRLLKKNVEEGAPVTISNILMSVTVLVIGNICFNALGERGFFFWSVCLQMLLVAVVFVNGVMEALFAIGGVLLGEHDLEGLHLLVRRALISVGVLVCVQIAVM
jgi:Na+-driven multidrug efflux pump